MIKYFIPYSTEKNIGKEYNESMSLLPNDEDWGVFLDGDAMFTVHNWGHHISACIEANPEYKLFTCVTNRVGTQYQCVDQMWNEEKVSSHWEKGLELQSEKGIDVIDITHCSPLSGVLIAVQKKIWKEVGGFSENGMLGVDNSIHYNVRDNGYKVGLMEGVYALHYYRNGKPENKKHLL